MHHKKQFGYLCMYIATFLSRILQHGLGLLKGIPTTCQLTWVGTQPWVSQSSGGDLNTLKKIYEEFLPFPSFLAQEKEVSLSEGWQILRVNNCQQNTRLQLTVPQLPVSVSWPEYPEEIHTIEMDASVPLFKSEVRNSSESRVHAV